MSTYLMWGLINSVTDILSEPFREADRKFNLATQGGDPSAKQPRWETCLGKVNAFFGKVTGRMFVDSHFQGRSKSQVKHCSDNVTLSFNHFWIDRRGFISDSLELVKNLND